MRGLLLIYVFSCDTNNLYALTTVFVLYIILIMARPRDSAAIKTTKLEATKTFVRFVENHCNGRSLRPRDFEELLGIGGELKNGVVWNAYWRGARAMQPNTLKQKIALAAQKNLLNKKVAAYLAHMLDARLAFARLLALGAESNDEAVGSGEVSQLEDAARWRSAVKDVTGLSLQAEILLTDTEIHELLRPIVAWSARLETGLVASRREQADLDEFYAHQGEHE